MKTYPRAAAGLQLPSLLALAVSLLLSWPLLQLVDAQATQRDRMTWVPASNPMALCNDFTRAGFFIRRNTASDNWVVFLESGGLCYDRASCNRRFFVRTVRLQNKFCSSVATDITRQCSKDNFWSLIFWLIIVVVTKGEKNVGCSCFITVFNTPNRSSVNKLASS